LEPNSVPWQSDLDSDVPRSPIRDLDLCEKDSDRLAQYPKRDDRRLEPFSLRIGEPSLLKQSASNRCQPATRLRFPPVLCESGKAPSHWPCETSSRNEPAMS